jgi:hypothetical protein
MVMHHSKMLDLKESGNGPRIQENIFETRLRHVSSQACRLIPNQIKIYYFFSPAAEWQLA